MECSLAPYSDRVEIVYRTAAEYDATIVIQGRSYWNQVVGNFVDKEIHVAEPLNMVEDNVRGEN